MQKQYMYIREHFMSDVAYLQSRRTLRYYFFVSVKKFVILKTTYQSFTTSNGRAPFIRNETKTDTTVWFITNFIDDNSSKRWLTHCVCMRHTAMMRSDISSKCKMCQNDVPRSTSKRDWGHISGGRFTQLTQITNYTN